MLTLFLVLGLSFLITVLLNKATTAQAKADMEKENQFAQKARDEIGKLHEKALPALAQRMRLQAAKPVYTEPPKAEYEEMLLPYPDRKGKEKNDGAMRSLQSRKVFE
jgi:hypothetical protein